MKNVRIQDDLYTFVNQETLDKLVIPDHLPCIGGFQSLNDDVQKIMINEFKEMCDKDSYPNEYLKRACTLYKIIKDVEKKEKDGILPALNYYSGINDLKSIDYLNKLFKSFVLKGILLPLEVSVETDMKNTKNHCVYIKGPGVILPDASYYKKEMAPQKEMILGIFKNVIKLVMEKTDLSKEEQQKYIDDTLAFDEILGGLVKTSEEWSEYIESYNPMDVNEVAELLKPLDFKYILNDLFGCVPEKIIVSEPRFIKAFSSVLNENTLELYKHWAYVLGIYNSCGLLTEELRELGSRYYRAISGIKEGTPIEKYAYQLASNMYSEPVGLYYGEKYFGEAAKKDITEIVYQIIDTYKSRIKENEILVDATKEKAILKLSKMGVKMGYPDKVLDIYNKLVYNENDSLFNIVKSLNQIKNIDELSKLNKETDPTKWAMPGHMVNACYDPSVNDITFPAAILQAPFYSIKQTRSENLGGIGAVIGHEISHAFDSNGAKCDENGNINNWWTEEDKKRFEGKIKEMIEQFDGIELPWGKVNGNFIVSENMADNGGMGVTLEIMSKTPNASFEEYFTNWAKVWCLKAKEEYLQLLLNVDVHGPSILRANIPPRNFKEWYETFDVKETDKMYIAPNKRIVIW